ncbi:MAG TPA: hypothetical protein VK973_14010 [Arenicellales bacterium]|nr:hypothetical protein [Arenicellales bacterium]
MNHSRRIAALLCVLLVAAAPAQAGTDQEAGQPKPSKEQKWSQTMETLRSYSAEQRDEAVETGRKTLEAMDARLERMESWTQRHWDSMSDEAREQRTRMLNTMRRHRNEAAEWYGGMKHSSAEAWDRVKQGFIRSYDKLQQAYGDAVESFHSDEPAGSAGNQPDGD